MSEATEAELERLREVLRAIKRIGPQPIGTSGFYTGPRAHIDAAQRMATLALSKSKASARQLESMLAYSRGLLPPPPPGASS